MSFDLQGTTALITGASAGIGRELARVLGSRVARLVLVARRTARLEELAAELRARHPGLEVRVEGCDVASEPAVEELVSRLEAAAVEVDVLVNNAGLGDQSFFPDAEWERIRQAMMVNVLALVRLTHLLVPGMVGRGRGAVVNIGSGAGFVPMPYNAVYAATKHFVNGFSESLRAELAPAGIVVTQVCPGPVPTEFQEVAGLGAAGMAGSPPAAMIVTAETCAREAVRGLERARPIVFPGRFYRFMMRLLGFLPRALIRRKARRDAQTMWARRGRPAGA